MIGGEFQIAVTDILNADSKIIVLGDRSDIAEKAFNITLENHVAILPGVVSRKKQVVPAITNAIG